MSSMSKLNNINLYSGNDHIPFEYKGSVDTRHIALQTKRLIVNTDNYHDYIQKFYNNTKLIKYKLPLIQTDQAVKAKKISSQAYLTRKESEGKFLSGDFIGNFSIDSNFSPQKSNDEEKIKNLKNLNISKINSKTLTLFGSVNENFGFNFRNDNSLKYSNMFLTDVFKKFKLLNVTESKNTPFSLLQQFSENYFNFDCEDLKYEENKIFKQKEFYKSFIKEKLILLNSGYTINRTYKLHKTFNSGLDKEISITLHSIRIEFKNLDINSNLKLEGIYIPFELLPVFVTINLENFKYILLSAIRFNQNFDEAILNESDFFSSLEALQEKDMEINSFYFFKKGTENILKFMWITPNNNFQVQIQLPQIEFHIEKNSKTLKKYINHELLFYILNLNFLNWEFYVVNYLISHKEFRIYLNRVFSKADPSHIKHRSLASIEQKMSKFRLKSSMELNLSKEKEEKEHAQYKKSSIIDYIINENPEINFSKVKESSYCELFSNEIKINEYSEKDYQLSFLVTTYKASNYDEEKDSEQVKEFVGFLYKLVSFSVDITNLSGAITSIKLNIKEMKILSYLSKFGKIEKLLKKLILCDNNKGYYIDSAFFDKFDKKNLVLLDHLFYSSKIKENCNKIQLEKCPEDNQVKIDINWPKISRVLVKYDSERSDKGDDKVDKQVFSKDNAIGFDLDEVTLDKINLDKICVKDLQLMIELLVKEISFKKIREIVNHSPSMLMIPKFFQTPKLSNNVAKSPKMK